MAGLCLELELGADLGSGAALITVIRGTSLHVSLLARDPQHSRGAGCPALTISSETGFSQLFHRINHTLHATKPQQPARTWPQKANPALLHLVSQGHSGALGTRERLNKTPRAHKGFPWRQITPLEGTRQATLTCFPHCQPSTPQTCPQAMEKHQLPSQREHRRFSSAQRQVSRSQERFKRPLCTLFFQSLLLCQALQIQLILGGQRGRKILGKNHTRESRLECKNSCRAVP